MPEYKQVPGFFRGLNIFNRPDAIEDTQLSSVKNLRIVNDNLQLDNGYVLEDPDVGTDTMKRVYTMENADGTRESFLFTLIKLYVWSGTGWTEVKDSNGYSLNDTINRTTDAISGTELKRLKAVTFVGSVNGGGKNMVIWTNGVDVVHKIWFSEATWVCDAIAGLTDISVETCLEIQIWRDAVWIMNTEEDGTVYPNRMRACVPSDEEKWDTATYSSALYYDLLRPNNVIQQAEILGDNMIIYCLDGIWRGTWTGDTDLPVYFENIIANEGVIGGLAVANIGDWHMFIGKSNVYRYTGGLSIQPIGNLIQKRIYGESGVLDLSYLEYIAAIHVKETDTVWLMFPSLVSGDELTYILRYSVKHGAWTERQIPLLLTSLGTMNPELDDTWGGATGRDGTWLEEGLTGEEVGPDRAWLSQVFTSDFPYVFLTCVDADQKENIIRYDYLQTKDGIVGSYDANGYLQTTAGTGSNIAYTLRTKNFAAGPITARFEYLEINLSGDTDHVSSVYFSIDDGQNWTLLGTITINSSDQKRYFVWNNISFDNIMFEFRGAGGNVSFGKMNMAFHTEYL